MFSKDRNTKFKKSFNKNNKDDRFEVKEIERRRRTKVTKGGRRFNMSSLSLVGDGNRSVASGYSKGKEAIDAFKKSIKKAKKNLINYFPEKKDTIPHNIEETYKSIKIIIRPSSLGTGIKAGGLLRDFFKMLSIKNVTTKIIGRSRNKANVIRAIFMAMDKITGKNYKNY